MTSEDTQITAPQILSLRTIESIDIESTLSSVHSALSTLERLAYNSCDYSRYKVARDLLRQTQRELIRGLVAPISESDVQKLKEVIDNAPF